MSKQDGRKLSPAVQEALRLRVINFLKSRKGTQRQAADIFQLSLRAVEKIWKRYKEGGKKAVRQKKRGPKGSHRSLSDADAKDIKAIIKKDTPDQHHIPHYLWTAAAVRLLIKKKPE